MEAGFTPRRVINEPVSLRPKLRIIPSPSSTPLATLTHTERTQISAQLEMTEPLPKVKLRPILPERNADRYYRPLNR